jgi:uncharacterized protein (TIGR03067 family)
MKMTIALNRTASRALALAFVLLAGQATGSDDPRFDAATVASGLEGSWRLVARRDAREEKSITSEIVVTFRGGVCRWSAGDEQTTEGYQIDERPRPARLTMMSLRRAVVLRSCIYRIDGDTLRLAMSDYKSLTPPVGIDDPESIGYTFRRVR